MIGHRQIVALRADGERPAGVFVHVGPHPATVWPWQHPEAAIERCGMLPTVWTGDADPAVEDLRWLHGLTVHVVMHGGSSESFWRWWDAIKAAKPRRMFAQEPDGEVVTWQV